MKGRRCMSLVENGVVKAERFRTLWLARERFYIHDLEEVDGGRDGGHPVDKQLSTDRTEVSTCKSGLETRNEEQARFAP